LYLEFEMKFLNATILACSLTLSSATAALAGGADVEDVVIKLRGDGTYLFDVTVRHADEGWDHYADSWEILTPDGEVLGTRKLAHPHVDEQPFTRSLSMVAVPDGVTQVRVRAGDSVHGFSGKEMTVALPDRQ
jgi:hypothetical protein